MTRLQSLRDVFEAEATLGEQNDQVIDQVSGLIDYFLLGRKGFTLTKTAYVRIAIIGCLTITGILGVMNNLNGITFSQGFAMLVDLGHMGLTVIFLLTALALLILKKGWSFLNHQNGNYLGYQHVGKSEFLPFPIYP